MTTALRAFLRSGICWALGHCDSIRHPLAGQVCPRCGEHAYGHVSPIRPTFDRARYMGKRGV